MNRRPKAFKCLAGPYTEGEGWMRERVVADLERGSIEHCVERRIWNGRKATFVYRTTKGWRE